MSTSAGDSSGAEPLFRVISEDGKKRSKPWSRERIVREFNEGKLLGLWKVRNEATGRAVTLRAFLNTTSSESTPSLETVPSATDEPASYHLRFALILVPLLLVMVIGFAYAATREGKRQQENVPDNVVASPVGNEQEKMDAPIQASMSEAWQESKGKSVKDYFNGGLRAIGEQYSLEMDEGSSSPGSMQFRNVERSLTLTLVYRAKKLTTVTVEKEKGVGLTRDEAQRETLMFTKLCVACGGFISVESGDEEFLPALSDWLTRMFTFSGSTTIRGAVVQRSMNGPRMIFSVEF